MVNLEAFEAAFKSVLNPEEIRQFRGSALNDDLNTHIIDTCLTGDTMKWETGIEPRGKEWIIVEQYESKEDAYRGHKKWITSLKENPEMKLKSCEFWEI